PTVCVIWGVRKAGKIRSPTTRFGVGSSTFSPSFVPIGANGHVIKPLLSNVGERLRHPVLLLLVGDWFSNDGPGVVDPSTIEDVHLFQFIEVGDGQVPIDVFDAILPCVVSALVEVRDIPAVLNTEKSFKLKAIE